MEKRMSYEEFTYRLNEPITDELGKSPIIPVFSLLQGKWRMPVIYALFCMGESHFNRLEEFCDGITPAALTTVLNDLTNEGLVKRNSPSGDRYSTYELTQKGNDLLPCFYEMMNWGFYYRVSKKVTKKKGH